MGLDMYLEKRRHLSQYNEKDKVLLDQLNTMFGIDPKTADIMEGIGVKNVTFAAGYWRKANAIHEWFVDNVQSGTDDCRQYGVSKEQLKELYDLVSKAIKTKDSSLLPPSDGFFFGTTEINSEYWQDLKLTAAMLKTELAFIKTAEKKKECYIYYYRASW